ncbi:MAG: MerR family transcriptional regulator, partial [Solirubrobacterales bacterium]|nr:MerR family transcriptional regulator [Solirubrobacterales bacterium]
TILRLQRDEFLPLRVIRQELAGGRTERDVAAPGDGRSLRRATVSPRESGALYTLEDVVEETGADSKLVSELVDFGVIKGESRGGVRHFDETEREIVRAVSELARYGVGGRNLRVFRSSADREAQLLQSILAPALRSRNPDRRKEAIEALENLASVTTYLKHLLLIRDLRKIAT